MKLTILLIGIAALIQSNAAAPCSSITIASHVQDSEVLKKDVPSPYQLAIDRDTNTLFFSYTSNKDNTFDSVYISLKDKTSDTIPGVAGGFANAVDHQKQIVYIGGSDGIYKFDYESKEAVKQNITDKNIWQLFFKDGLYFTTYPDEKAYLYKDGIVKLVPGLEDKKAMLVALDKNDDLVYSQGGELMKLVKGQVVNIGDYNVNAFNTDASGNLYFSTPEAIYKFVDGRPKKVTSIDNIYGFAIEGENTFIYAGDSSVVRLRPTPELCADDEKENEVIYANTYNA